MYNSFMAIQSFASKSVKKFFETGNIAKNVGWSNIFKIALRKLDMIDYAIELNDLKSPPNNKLEQLKGNLKGFHSIRINAQWRIIFRWSKKDVFDVNIVDYHK